VAVVPDAYLNPPAGSGDPLVELAEAGWGVVALPRPGLAGDVEDAVLAGLADQLAAFVDDGYEVVLAAPDDPISARLRELLGRRSRSAL
jgi:hypothetical protein